MPAFGKIGRSRCLNDFKRFFQARIPVQILNTSCDLVKEENIRVKKGRAGLAGLSGTDQISRAAKLKILLRDDAAIIG